MSCIFSQSDLSWLLVRESWTSMGLTKIKRIVSSGARMNTILSSVIVQVALVDILVAQLRAA